MRTLPACRVAAWSTPDREHQRCGNKPAQGNALGTEPHAGPALKGRHNFCRPFRAKTFSQSIPRALPWAGLWPGRWPYQRRIRGAMRC